MQNNELIKQVKFLKNRLKEKENEINNYKIKLKESVTGNNIFPDLNICKEKELIYLSQKRLKDKSAIKIKGYNDNSTVINYNNSLIDKDKDKEKDKEKSNSSQYKNNSIKKYSKTNLLYSVNNTNKNRLNKNKTQNYYNYMNKIQKNITNILDFFHDQNDCYSPCNFNPIDSTSFKKENQMKSKSKESSPSSQNKLKSSTINNNNTNRNNSQVMINVNTNIINSNGSIEKLKIFKKIKDYHKIFDRKLNEMTRNIIPKSIKRTLSAFQNRRNSSPNFYDNNRQFSNKHVNKNSNLKKKKIITPNKNKQINSTTNKKYHNISVHSSGKMSINNFRKKTPHRVITQRKEITPNLKINRHLYSSSNSNNKQSKLKSSNNNQNKIIKKNSLSNNNNTNIVSNKNNNSNYNSNNIIKNHNKIKDLLNSHNNSKFNHFKKLNQNNIIDGILNNALVNANIKNRSGANTINSSSANNHNLRKFIFTNSTYHGKY